MSRLPLWMNPNIACKRLGQNLQHHRFTSSPLPPSLAYAGAGGVSLSFLPDGRAFPVQLLAEKRAFCATVDESSGCIRCQLKKRGGGGANRTFSCTGDCNGSDGGGGGSRGCCRTTPMLISSFSSVTSSSNASVLSIMMNGHGGHYDSGCQDSGFGASGDGSFVGGSGGKNLSTSGASFDTSVNSGRTSVGEFEKTCSFCYVHFKKHCQKFDRPWPRIEDAGFWHGHCTKDENGNVECPELFKLMCPLCFATGAEAHTLKFCPLNSLEDK